ncbi:MAG: anaerobic sulfatase maturase [Promethearchaeota archaeon]
MDVEPFQLLVKPASDRCNAACSYCFYRGTGASVGSGCLTPPEVLEATVTKYLRLGFRVNSFIWQGGEPTVAGLAFFRDAVALQAARGSRGQVVANAFQTNGRLLDDRWAAFFANYRFFLGVSVDGNPRVNDAARGVGAHAAAVRAVRCLRRAGVEYNLLAVLHRRNAAAIVQSYQHLKTLGRHVQFIPAFQFGGDGKPTDESVDPRRYGRALLAVFDAWRRGDVGRTFLRTFDAVLNAFVGVPPGSCTFGPSCAPYLVVEANGDVFPCDFFVAPKWRLGNVLTDDLAALARRRREEFAALKAATSPRCRTCTWLPLCHGGCLKDRPPGPSWPRVPSAFCEAYRSFFEATFHWFAELSVRVARARSLPFPRFLSTLDPSRECPCGSGLTLERCAAGPVVRRVG